MACISAVISVSSVNVGASASPSPSSSWWRHWHTPKLQSIITPLPSPRPTDAHPQPAAVPALRGKDYGKTKMRYPDYIETESGLQYKDLRVGSGPTPKIGETVVVDWDGYTIGYYGRIFEARNKTKGGSFEGGDKEFYKFKIGSEEVIPAFQEAVSGMALGGVRRIIVPPELGYPDNDFNKKGPRPTTFSGQRALDFVLRNQGLIDKTLLFDIELLKIVPT
nr:peptidyl-prolyl cis-trans isomerase FKBP19, chloroplastic-like isoform X2 [Coffea arabica]